MKKSFFAILLALALVFTCGFACGKTPDKSETKYRVTITNNNDHGSITGVGELVDYSDGTELTITVTANDQYKILAVTWNNEPVAITNEKTFSFKKTITANSALSVTYEGGWFMANVVNDDTKGTIVGIESGKFYKENSSITFSITPKLGYVIESIQWNNNIPESITNNGAGQTLSKYIDRNFTLTVTYKKESVVATLVNDDTKGTVSGFSSNSNLTKGDVLNITITPKTGYVISSVLWNSLPVTIENTNGFTFSKTVSGDCALQVTYAPTTHTVTLSYNSLAVQIDGAKLATGAYYYGEQDEITVSTVNPAFKLLFITVNGVPVTITDANKQTCTFTITITGDTVIAVTEDAKYQVSANTADDNFNISGVELNQRLYNSNQTIIVTLSVKDNNNYLREVIVNGFPVTVNYTDETKSSGTIALTILGDTSLIVNVSAKYKVTADTTAVNVNGVTLNANNYFYQQAIPVTIAVKDNANYIKTVKVNGITQTVQYADETKSSLTFTLSFTGNMEIDVETDAKMKITAQTNNAMYSISGATFNANAYAPGQTVSLTVAVKDQASVITSISVNGTPVTITNNKTQTFNVTITANTTIDVMIEGWSENV